jgi:hypothetical protein
VPPKKAKTTRRPHGKHSWALIPVDGQPIRDRARKEYAKILRDLELARQELERFEEKDKPAFSRWLNGHFGALMTELRETSRKLEEKRELLFEVETEALLSNSSHTRAYERVMWQREHPETEESSGAEDTRSNEGSAGGAGGANPFADAFDEFFDDVNFDKAFGLPPRKKGPSADSNEGEVKAARIKELYRALVRRLHPDAQGTLTAKRAEWWHQAQAAYENGDLEQLQVIFTLCEIDETGSTAKTSVSLLMQITRQFKSSLRALKKQLSQCRHDPAWNFTKTEEHGPLLARLERSMREELAEMKRLLGAIASQIDAWARQARMPRRFFRRRRSMHPEFFF